VIRHDYILQMIEEFGRALARIRALRQNRRWEEARNAVDAECEKLAATGAQGLAALSETELLARLTEGQSTEMVRQRLFLVITLLGEAGEIAEAAGRAEEGREARLKALHLLLEVLAQVDARELPEFVPRVEGILASLCEKPLPSRTQVLLMRHYEGTGQFAKAEDALFAILEASPGDAAAISFGLAFYDRILRQSDAMLMAGNLPRAEAEQGLRELKSLKHP
jgi:hypothetical protein